MDVIYDHFEERIEPNDGDAKFADVWPIENIWEIMKGKIRGKRFENLDPLVDFIRERLFECIVILRESTWHPREIFFKQSINAGYDI